MLIPTAVSVLLPLVVLPTQSTATSFPTIRLKSKDTQLLRVLGDERDAGEFEGYAGYAGYAGVELWEPLHVVETDWTDSFPGVETLEARSSEPSVPVSAAVQTEWVRDIVRVVEGVSSGLGAGVLYWEPAWVNNTGSGSGYADAILFAGDYSDYPTSVVGDSRASVNMFLGV
jgi:hypothetical protein